MLKIIYFDENSAMDYLEISNGGILNTSTAKEKKKGSSIATTGEAEIVIDTGMLGKILSVIQAKIKVASKANLGLETSSIIKTTISNTILSEYSNQAKNDQNIEKIENYKVNIQTNSFAYIKLFSPYIKMMNLDDLNNSSGVNFTNIDEILKESKGYYSILVESDNDKKILRFNIKAFRNNYNLTDLLRMNLTFYGIKVGQSSVEALSAGREFANEIEKELTQDDLNKRSNIENPLDLIDVVLAGVDFPNKK